MFSGQKFKVFGISVIIVILHIIIILNSVYPVAAASVVNTINHPCERYIRGFDASKAFPYQYRSCLERGVANNVVNEVKTAQDGYKNLKDRFERFRRSGSNFYELAAQDCQDERRIRQSLERMIQTASRMVRRSQAAYQVMSMVVRDTAEELRRVRGMRIDSRREFIDYFEAIEKRIQRENDWTQRKLSVLQTDLRRTDVVNRCRPKHKPDRSGRIGGIRTTTVRLANGRVQFNNPTIDGYALHACPPSSPTCAGKAAKRAAREYCRRQGFSKVSSPNSFSSHSSVPVKNIWSGKIYPKGAASVWRKITCSP